MAANNNSNSDSDSTEIVQLPCKVKTTKFKQKCSESRKIRKPLMEKKRRARINQSLNELKQILLDANNGTPNPKHGNRPSKLEKADILELTVSFLQSLQQQQNISQKSPNKYKIQPSSTDTTSTSKPTSTDNTIMHNHNEVNEINDTQNSLSQVQVESDQGLAISTSEFRNGVSNHKTDINENSSFLDGFTHCTGIITSTLLENLRPRQNEQIQKKLRHVLDKYLEGLKVKANSSTSSIKFLENNCNGSSEIKSEVNNNNDCFFHVKEEQDLLLCVPKSNNIDKGYSTYLVPTRLNNGNIVFAIKHQQDEPQVCNSNNNNNVLILKQETSHQNSSFHLTDNQSYNYLDNSTNHVPIINVNNNSDNGQVVQYDIWRPW